MTRTSPPDPCPSEQLEVERALHATYLGVEDGDRSPLVCIDATSERLDPVLAGFEPRGGQHAAVLARACGGSDEALSVFEGGPARLVWSDPDTCGVLRYLLLASVLLARPEDAASDGADPTRNFRANLGRIFGRGSAASIAGLPALWDLLARWSFDRAALRADVRPVLPSPNEVGRGETHRWRHLGTTYRMTLPSWRDAMKFETLLKRRPSLLEEIGPAELARELPGILLGAVRFSPPFTEAAESFVDLHERRAGLLGHHRFWHVFETVAERMRGAPNAPLREARQRVRLLLDDRVRVELPSGTSGAVESLSPDHAVALLRDRIRGARPGAFSSRLRAMVDLGAIVFHRTGLGVGEIGPPDGTVDDAPVWLLLAEPHRARVEAARVSCRYAGPRWWLAEPLDPDTAATVVAALGLELGGPSRHRAEQVRLEGGLRIGARSWLGLPEFLPAVRAGVDAGIQVDPADVELVREGDLWRLRAKATLEGARTFTVEERDGIGHGAIVVRGMVRFVPEASPHPRLGAPSDEGRWESGDGTRADPDVAPATDAVPTPDALPAHVEAAFDDDPVARLLEAVYAGGRSGWSERALMALLERSPVAAQRSGFGVLAALEEAGWLASARSIGWRSRRWWLVPPRLAGVDDDPSRSILRGSTPRAVRRRFVRTVHALGGRVLEVRSEAIVCPPVLVGIEVEREALLTETGWELERPAPRLSGAAPRCWMGSRDDGATHELVASWNWTSARFDGPPDRVGAGATIDRLRRERGDRHDLYRVRGGSNDPRSLLTPDRSIAVTEAYRLAGVPFLKRDGDRLIAPRDDARLPLSVSRYLRRLQPFAVSGPAEVRGRQRYSYPGGAAIETALRRIYGPRFVDGAWTRPPRTDPFAAEVARRAFARRGRRVGDAARSLLVTALASPSSRSR